MSRFKLNLFIRDYQVKFEELDCYICIEWPQVDCSSPNEINRQVIESKLINPYTLNYQLPYLDFRFINNSISYLANPLISK